MSRLIRCETCNHICNDEYEEINGKVSCPECSIDCDECGKRASVDKNLCCSNLCNECFVKIGGDK